MAVIAALFALFLLFLTIGAVLGWVAMSRASRLENTLLRLDQRVRSIEAGMSKPQPRRSGDEQAAATPDTGPTARTPIPAPATSARPARPAGSFLDPVIANMRRNWMAWLGGVCVALAGIFLVGYGIEMGYLGPRARIAAAIVAGVVLHVAAEYLRRKTGSAEPAFAAMAGGASITLYAALFAALELYNLMSPGLTFALLAVVSLGTMALATVHGPQLAAIGILGGYFVPMLVPGYGGTSLADLSYSLVVTTAALFLIRFVYRPWLWYGTLAGVLGWWILSLDNGDADGYRGYYLAAFAYLALAIPVSDWLLKRTPEAGDPATEVVGGHGRRPIDTMLVTIVLVALAQAASILNLGFTGFVQALLQWSPLTLIIFRALRTRDSLAIAPWILLVTQLVAWFALSPDGAFASEFLAFALATAALFSVGCWLARRDRPFSHLHASLIGLAPVLWIALAYRVGTDLAMSWEWAVATLALGLGYLALAGRRLERRADDASTIWLILAGHIAYSLAAAMFFREATLTLALAAQLMSLAWLGRRFSLPALAWLLKGVIAIVIARLTFNPWIMTYDPSTHWSLWTYGGATLACFFAARLAGKDFAIRKWLEAAALHLLVLFLGAETRYWLYDGQIFVREFTLTEAAINTTIWGGLGLTYFNRARHSQHLATLYTICSRILLGLALASYAASLTALNPLFGAEPIAATKFWNIMLLAYGAPVLVAILARLFYEEAFRKLASAIGAAGFFVFVNLEIRHFWHAGLDPGLGASNGEIYTYSAVWLAMAVGTMLAATKLGSRDGYRAGIGLLCLVIAKIFLYDMAGLEGLLRVTSFLGLGLTLLGLAWLYQRTAREIKPE
jgi:uncharacterized membrane protein